MARRWSCKAPDTISDAQYSSWNDRLRPALAENGIRILELSELDTNAADFLNDYCEREVDPLLTPITIDPAHPFPRVVNKALCLAFLLRRRRNHDPNQRTFTK